VRNGKQPAKGANQRGGAVVVAADSADTATMRWMR
jgi:hypothetical protein